MEITEELKAKAYACETAGELLALAAENGIELTEEEAELILDSCDETREGELADTELNGVAGGQAGCKRNAHEVVYYKSCAEVEFIFYPGDVKQAFIGEVWGNETATVRITESRTKEDDNGWYDVYKYNRISGAPTTWGFEWQKRSRFEK